MYSEHNDAYVRLCRFLSRTYAASKQKCVISCDSHVTALCSKPYYLDSKYLT
jgi:hypothetical protein